MIFAYISGDTSPRDSSGDLSAFVRRAYMGHGSLREAITHSADEALCLVDFGGRVERGGNFIAGSKVRVVKRLNWREVFGPVAHEAADSVKRFRKGKDWRECEALSVEGAAESAASFADNMQAPKDAALAIGKACHAVERDSGFEAYWAARQAFNARLDAIEAGLL